MDCLFCDHPKAHKHGKTSKGGQRYRCAACRRTFTDTFDTLYCRRQVTPEQVEIILQAHAEGSSLRGISRIGKRAYGTVVDIVLKASYEGQLVHNEEVEDVECRQITADEMWSFVKKQKRCEPDEIAVGDCWLGISLANESGLILSLRVGKHTDAFLQELVANTEGKTACQLWCTDNWGGYERVPPEEITHYIGKENTQRLERTNGIVRQQTGWWYRRQNKFGKLWKQIEVTARLVVSYFNWIWQHSRTTDTAAQRTGLSIQPWDWHDIATYPTFYCFYDGLVSYIERTCEDDCV